MDYAQQSNGTKIMRINIEVAPGELIDRITILEIKLANITDEDKLRSIHNELETLGESARRMRESLEGEYEDTLGRLDKLALRLKEINQQIWDIEDRIRDLERDQDFGEDFVETARSVYFTNDQRAELKKEISMLFGSDIAEAKSYSEYKCKSPD
jgi:predicted  nucleic acid-binding Zn-ribbon protein